jgi:flagellar motor component MotA
MKSNKLGSNMLPIVVAILAILAIIFGFMAFKNGYIPNNETLILTFVGILATFIVISNYAQVKDIESKLEKKSKALEERLDSKINEALQVKKDFGEMQDKFNAMRSEFDKLQKVTKFINNESAGNIAQLIAEFNRREGFFLNMIGNYIGAIDRHALIDQTSEFVKKDIETLML